MKDYILEFEAFLKNEKASSNNTLQSYLRDVSQFSAYCKLNAIEDASKVTPKKLNEYFDYLHSTGRSDATVSRNVASLRCYFKFLVKKGICSANPVSDVKQKAAAKKIPEILTNKEVLLLLEQPKGSDYKSIRDKAMLELLYATGIKVSELIDLNLTDINRQIGVLHLRTEKNERVIPIYPEALRVLNRYINEARGVIISENSEDKLFTNMNGSPMSRQGFWKIIKHYAELAEIAKDITPHTLRHSFAAHLLENGAELKDIKEMLGHSDISSTQIYVQMMKQKYAQAYKRFHPMAR